MEDSTLSYGYFKKIGSFDILVNYLFQCHPSLPFKCYKKLLRFERFPPPPPPPLQQTGFLESTHAMHSRECQVKDWPTHKIECNSNGSLNTDGKSKLESSPNMQSRSVNISNSSDSSTQDSNLHDSTCTHIEFQAAFNQLNISAKHQEAQYEPDHKAKPSYLLHNVHFFDVPAINETHPLVTIIVRANKTKTKIKVHNSWDSKSVFKYLSHNLEIPLDKLKLIHKGQMVTQDDEKICSLLKDKAVFQAIGEKAEDDSGVNNTDIEVIMKQLGGSVERNDAVKALKETGGDVVDAMLHLGNK